MKIRIVMYSLVVLASWAAYYSAPKTYDYTYQFVDQDIKGKVYKSATACLRDTAGVNGTCELIDFSKSVNWDKIF